MRPTSSWADNGWEGTSGRLRYDIEFMKAPKINFTLHNEPFDYRLPLFFSDSFIETNRDAYWIKHINLWSNHVIIGRRRPPCSALCIRPTAPWLDALGRCTYTCTLSAFRFQHQYLPEGKWIRGLFQKAGIQSCSCNAILKQCVFLLARVKQIRDYST